MPPEWLALLFTGLLAAGAATGPEPVDAELLEFLGSFETADARWLDPLSLGEPASIKKVPVSPPPGDTGTDPSRLEKKHAD